MRGRLVILVVALATAWATPRHAGAQSSDDVTRGAARALGYSGVEAYQAGDYESASEKLEKAYVVLRVPSLGLWSARALVKRGKLVEASGRYLEVTTLEVSGGDVDVQKQAQADAKIELDLLGPRIPSLTVRLENAEPHEVTVMLDVRPLATPLIGEPLSLNPGRHTLEARRGSELQAAEVTLAEEQHETVVLKFAPPVAPVVEEPPVAPAQLPLPPTPPPPLERERWNGQTTVGWITLGAGAAGLGVGALTGLLALQKKGLLDDECVDNRCENDAGPRADRVNSYNNLRTFSSIGFIAGGALVIGGTVLLVTVPGSKQSVALAVGPSTAALRGNF